MYRSWATRTRRLHVVGLQLAGREERFGEAPHRTVSASVGELADRLTAEPSSRYAVFGHSMGALVAFELVRELRRRRAPPPLHLFVSGRIAPQTPVSTAFYALGDDELIDTLRRSGGTPEAVLAERELILALLPTLRADFELNERYAYRHEPPLDVPITAFAGSRDTIAPIEGVAAWREQTSRQFRLLAFDEGHFFVKSDEAALVRVIERAVYGGNTER